MQRAARLALLAFFLGFFFVYVSQALAQQDSYEDLDDLSASEREMLPQDLREQYKNAKEGKETSKDLEDLSQEEKKRLQDLKEEEGDQEDSEGEGDQEDSDEEDKEQEQEDDQDEARVIRQGSNISKIERQYRQGYNTPLASGLTQYGYDVFEQASVEPSQLAVPHDSYTLGPGDQLRIRLWGSSIDTQYTETIAPDGTLDIPKVGIIPLAGAKLGEAESIIRKEATKYVQGINLDVSLEKLRSVEVYVVGAVRQPGIHLVPAFSTVLKGLSAAGGVERFGTLRRVKLYRDGKLVENVDLYDLLLEGSRQSDIALKNKDVIFVPRIGKTAAVAGAVHQEGIFELNEEESIGELLELAGGEMPQAFTGRIHLRRFEDNQDFVVEDIDTRQEEEWQGVQIQDGDLLVLRDLEEMQPAKTIELVGHVWQEDEFKFEPGLKLSDVLSSKSLLRPEAVTDFGLLRRYDRENTRYSIKKFPLQKLFQGEFDLELEPFDEIIILSRDEVGIEETVRVSGAVWNEGTYQHRPDMTLEDLLAQAGGTNFGAALEKVEVSRHSIEDGQVRTEYQTLDARENADFNLKPYDYVFVPRLKDAGETHTVEIEGEVKYPGTYRIKDDEQLSDVVKRAGGFTDQAYFYGAKFTSPEAREIQQQSIDRMVRDLELKVQQAAAEEAQTGLDEEVPPGMEAAQRVIDELREVEAEGRVALDLDPLQEFTDSDDDFRLSDGDRLMVPKRPSFVSVVGSVYSPSAYRYEQDMTVGDYLEKSGGPTDTANAKYTYVLKANGEVISKAQERSLFFDTFEGTKLKPGDTVVVPEKIERIPVLRTIRDVSDIVFKIATTAGVALSL